MKGIHGAHTAGPADPRTFTWGYWLGGTLCFLSLLFLSFGLAPVIQSVRNKPVVIQLPGDARMDLKLPGAYLAVCVTGTLTPEAVQRIYDLQYTVMDLGGKNFFDTVKIPPRKYASDQPDSQIPLFQFIVDKAGTYLLHSNYPFEIDGPQVSAILFHMDVRYVRTELFVGLALFLVCAIVGLLLIRKTYKASLA